MTLSNGLRVLALEDHTVPTVALHLLYRAGSRNERPGITGLSHLFEHMMFNGSARFPPGAFDALIEASGGTSNAFTTPDTTEYHEEFLPAALDVVLQLEADRMRALRLDRRNLEQERAIVKEERRVNTDNSLVGSMSELLWNTAFVAHPYRWDTIGFMKDLDAIRLEDARAYYRTYYAPNNAVLVLVGAFHTTDLLQKVRRYFGSIPRQPLPPPVVNSEPPQQGERRANLHRPAELPAVMIGYRVGTYRDPDAPALELLQGILSGGESGRLYRQLVYQDQIATEVWASNEARKDPGLFTFYAQARPGRTAAQLEQAIYAVLEDLIRNGVSPRELRKAQNAVRVHFEQRRVTNSGLAALLAHYEANWGNWRQMYTFLSRCERVTPAQIRHVARRVFTERQRTVVTLIPEQAAVQTTDLRKGK
ncbi:MAG: pitrilysin family protein [Chloroherpetonaceae bacterium]|nr:insulinase family protein [Chthonomonadaceae bacterium]MDW8208914.1 pitrilysin family protein [Chloroherpetonaceae bacterium]